jgi:hypothetical protein
VGLIVRLLKEREFEIIYTMSRQEDETQGNHAMSSKKKEVTNFDRKGKGMGSQE